MDVVNLINKVNSGVDVLNVVGDLISKFNEIGNICNGNNVVRNRQNGIKNNIRHKGIECKLYNLLKANEEKICVPEVNQEKKKMNFLQIAGMSFIPGYMYYKALNLVHDKMMEAKDKHEKHSVFDELFKESGLKEKMENDVYYRPSIVELNKFKEEYKLRANVDLIQMLAQYHK